MARVAEDAAKAAQATLVAQQAAEATKVAAVVPAAPTPVVTYSDNWYENWIFNKESGNNPGAINSNSGACGLGQALPCSKMPCSLSDYDCQANFFTTYAQTRYNGWEGAYQFWVQNHWW